MKRKDKGRKIYRTKEKNYYGKSPLEKFMSGLLTVLLIGGIGFLGYSAAEPLLKFTKHMGDKPDVIPAETTTADSESTIQEVSENTTESEFETTAVMEVPTEPPVTMESYRAFTLMASDLASTETLQTALDAIPKNQDIEYVEVPLKTAGGSVYYVSTVASKPEMKEFQKLNLVIISETIRNSGYEPTALISTFNDNILPSVDTETGYAYSDGTLWYDSALKAWTNPFSQNTISYLADITEEISGTGFDRIVCTDFVFPKFTDRDLSVLDERLSKSDRCMALTSAANLLYDTSVSNGASMFIEVSAADILGGNAEILQPMLLSVNTIVLNINIDELGDGVSDGHNYYEFKGTPAEKTEKCLGFVSESLSDFNVAVRISGSSLTIQELISVKEKIAEMGYNSFVLG